jgi:hypothetical protein
MFRHAIADLGPNEPCDPRIAPEDLWLRLDTQTFRKLPRTGGIVFGVHPVMARLGDFADAPLLPALIERVHREADPVLMKVRLLDSRRGVVLIEFAVQTRAQVRRTGVAVPRRAN